MPGNLEVAPSELLVVAQHVGDGVEHLLAARTQLVVAGAEEHVTRQADDHAVATNLDLEPELGELGQLVAQDLEALLDALELLRALLVLLERRVHLFEVLGERLVLRSGLLELFAQRRHVHAHLLQLLFQLGNELFLIFELFLIRSVLGLLFVVLLRQLVVLSELSLPLVFVVAAAHALERAQRQDRDRKPRSHRLKSSEQGSQLPTSARQSAKGAALSTARSGRG